MYAIMFGLFFHIFCLSCGLRQPYCAACICAICIMSLISSPDFSTTSRSSFSSSFFCISKSPFSSSRSFFTRVDSASISSSFCVIFSCNDFFTPLAIFRLLTIIPFYLLLIYVLNYMDKNEKIYIIFYFLTPDTFSKYLSISFFTSTGSSDLDK